MNQEAHCCSISQETYDSFHQYLPDFIMNQMCIDGIMYHPTFLYESVWNIIVLILLLVLRRYNPFRGEVFLSYIVLYSVGRFFIEGMRTDSLYFGFLRQAQLLSLVLIIGAVILIIYRRKIKPVSRRYNGKKLSSNEKGGVTLKQTALRGLKEGASVSWMLGKIVFPVTVII